jgi:hypothetical protein
MVRLVRFGAPIRFLVAGATPRGFGCFDRFVCTGALMRSLSVEGTFKSTETDAIRRRAVVQFD